MLAKLYISPLSSDTSHDKKLLSNQTNVVFGFTNIVFGFMLFFLDALKAFDRVLHIKLFEKLIQRKTLMCFVRPLKHWYKEQTTQIKWGTHLSERFHVSNGFRQGGVLSPYLFAVYLDDLSNELNNIKAECYIGEVLLNHLMLADDVCVFCPSVH